MQNGTPRFLVIRRDNIGDLVCTLPLIRQLRIRYPQAWIGALVTKYNAEVLQGNPDIDAIFTYQKSKHLEYGESAFWAMVERIKQLWRLRRTHIETVLLPASGSQPSARRMAMLIGAKRTISQDDVPANPQAMHEVERTSNILRALKLPESTPPAAILYPRSELETAMRKRLCAEGGTVLGVHISSRKPSQRWPADHFIKLIRRLHNSDPSLRFVLFWSPGDSGNPLHPGDDRKAQTILSACESLPLMPCPTGTLAELIAGLSIVDQVICSDGGHMHLAAAVGKPIVCLFGKSDAARWHPWGLPYRLLQPESMNASDISVEEVIEALRDLVKGTEGVA
ncbi:MAG TPA: glycosyltransferase family 9 protein [Rhodocyclaceae bacterium]|nr:glycosyltransferase family 9 protein [Rhodocyclaceae bacterium]